MCLFFFLHVHKNTRFPTGSILLYSKVIKYKTITLQGYKFYLIEVIRAVFKNITHSPHNGGKHPKELWM